MERGERERPSWASVETSAGAFEIAAEEGDEFIERGGSGYLEVEVTARSGPSHVVYLVEESA